MASYRPKSLDELNDMYDKTITAEKAIIKATKQLHDATEKIVASDLPQEETFKEETKGVEEFSKEVDSLINTFREENEAAEIKPAKAAIAEMPQKISFEKEPETQNKNVHSNEKNLVSPPVHSKPKVHYSLETPDEIQQKVNAKSEERTDLFNDYMKIMNDEDDDFFSKHESLRKKDKKKKTKKGLFFRHEPKEENPASEESAEEPAFTDETKSEAPSPENDDTLPIKEVIYSPDVPDALQNLKVEFKAEESEDDNEEEFSSFTEYEPASPSSDSFEEAPYEPAISEEPAIHPDFDIIAQPEEELPLVPEEIANKTFEEFMDTSEDIYSFDPTKNNTIPEYAKGQYSEEEEEEDEEEIYAEENQQEDDEDEGNFNAPKNKKGIVAGRVLLSIILCLLCVIGSCIVGINTFLNVNTGKTAFGENYIFTATQNYTNTNILEGDLIVTEKRYANDGEVFAYINYTQQCFMFDKRNGSIVNDSGDVLFIAENDGERVLVLRDDTRGVVVNTYPGIGRILSLCTDYFIPFIAAILLLVLVIILLLSFVFKDKEKAYKKMMKKMIKKGVISADEESEFSTDENTAEEDLFSTVE